MRAFEIFRAELIYVMVKDAGFSVSGALNRINSYNEYVRNLFDSGAHAEEVSNSLLIGMRPEERF